MHCVNVVLGAGPLATSARDLALGFMLMAGDVPPLQRSSGCTSCEETPEQLAASQYGGKGPPPAHLLETAALLNLTGVRLGYFRPHFADASDDVRLAAEAALARLRACGAELIEVDLPNLHALSVAHGMSISVEFSVRILTRICSLSQNVGQIM